MAPSKEFLLLAATLLDALPPSLPINDSLLLQLHLVFGPMLVSALQLVDKREVVRVTLPSDRHVYQVASSTGKNYTIHLDPPEPTPLPTDALGSNVIPAAEEKASEDLLHGRSRSISSSPSPSPKAEEPDGNDENDGISISPFRTPSPPPRITGNPRPDTDTDMNTDIVVGSRKRKRKTSLDLAKEKAELDKRDRVGRIARELGKMYCPCAGWAYGCLAGEKTVLCKHLLAVIIAHKTGKEVSAQVGMPGVVSLLGLSS
ncbi:hypothetical protein IAU59_000306 [Kwoniella sp. CBS 9459]